MSDLKWPTAIEDGVKAISIASKAMFVLYCIGIAATGIAFIAALVGVVTGGRGSAILNFILNLVSLDTYSYGPKHPLTKYSSLHFSH